MRDCGIDFDDKNWNKFLENLKEFDDKRKDRRFEFNIKDNELKKRWSNNNITTLDFLNTVFDPKKNGIELINYDGSTKLSDNSEMWTDNKSILIKYSVWDSFVESVIEYYKK